jgi:Icc-related predicted phosphoesterase
MKLCAVGDVHGDFAGLYDLIEKIRSRNEGIDTFCVVGDMGIYPRKKDWEWRLQELKEITAQWPEVRFEFIDGNHDDHIALNTPGFVEELFDLTGWHFRRRGEYDTSTGVLYIGGADSVWFDMASRLVDICSANELTAHALLREIDTWPGNGSIKLAMKPRTTSYGIQDSLDLLNAVRVKKARNEILNWIHNDHFKRGEKTFKMLRRMLLQVEGIKDFRHWSIGEQISREDIDRALAVNGPVKLIISHTAPQQIVMDRFTLQNQVASVYEPSRHLLAELYEKVKPQKWVMGHWHKYGRIDDDTTRFTVLDTISNQINQAGRLLPEGLRQFGLYFEVYEL